MITVPAFKGPSFQRAEVVSESGPAVVVLNPHAARGRAARAAAPLRQWLERQAPTTPLVVCHDLQEAQRQLARQVRGVRAVVVGGDGSVQGLLPVLLEREGTLAVVPLGSGNDGARALGVAGWSWEQALSWGLQGPALAVDLGLCIQGDRRTPFFSSLAGGFDAAVGLRALTGPRWLRGQPRYLWATLREWVSLRSESLQVVADGRLLHDGPALFASVLNSPTYGSGMPAMPHAQIDDGHLNALVAGDFGRMGTAWMLPRLLAGWHLDHPRVRHVPVETFEVRSHRRLPLAADGEPIGSAQAWSVGVLKAAMCVVKAPSLATSSRKVGQCQEP